LRYEPALRIFGLIGWSGSNKTTLMAAVIPELITHGITVSNRESLWR
jgi:molybdopterin-guanine dinucleotide biosynthesis protein